MGFYFLTHNEINLAIHKDNGYLFIQKKGKILEQIFGFAFVYHSAI